MIGSILLLSAALSPNFSFTNSDRGKFEADIFAVNAEQNTEQTLALLITEEESDFNSAMVEVPIGEADEMTVTALLDAKGLPRVMYLYRLDLIKTERKWVCRIRPNYEGGPGWERSTRWCLSFIGGSEYRLTIPVR